jgi:hypothetical protein
MSWKHRSATAKGLDSDSNRPDIEPGPLAEFACRYDALFAKASGLAALLQRSDHAASYADAQTEYDAITDQTVALADGMAALPAQNFEEI